MTTLEDRILLHLQDGRRIPVDPQEIYLLEAEGGETLVKVPGKGAWHRFVNLVQWWTGTGPRPRARRSLPGFARLRLMLPSRVAESAPSNPERAKRAEGSPDERERVG